MLRLTRKDTLITGGTTGIGFSTAQAFLREGARVAFSGKDAARVEQARVRLEDQAFGHCADQTDLGAIDGMLAAVEQRFGGLDVLFLNAGVTWIAPVDAVDEAHFDGQIAINLKGTFFTLQRALGMLRPGASVIINASHSAHIGIPTLGVYAATKAALLSLTRTFAAELAPRDIRVNAIAPGPVETPLQAKLGLGPDEMAALGAQLQQRIPMSRFAQPAEIAEAVVFLASSDSSYMQGESITLDGGWTKT